MRVEGIIRGAIKRFNVKMLLDPFEGKFDIPSLSIWFGDGGGFEFCIIGQESINDGCGEVFICDHTEWLGVRFGGFMTSKANHFVADHTCGFVGFGRADYFVSHIVFGSCDERSALLMNEQIESSKVNISLINQTDGPSFNKELIQHLNVVNTCVSEMNEGRDVSSKVKERMHLDSTLTFAELSPRTEFKPKAGCAAVKGINHVVNIGPERVFTIEKTNLLHQNLSEIGTDSPILLFVCLGQSVSGNNRTDVAMMQFMGHGGEAAFDVHETIPLRKLCKAHNGNLVARSYINSTRVQTKTVVMY